MTSRLTSYVCCVLFLGASPTQAADRPPLPRNEQELEELFARAEKLEQDDRFKLLTSFLYRIHGWVDHPDHEGADELYERIQERLLSTPGHAEYVARQLREPWKAFLEGDRDQFNRYASLHYTRFKMLTYMPSPETVRVLASLFDYSSPPHPSRTDVLRPSTGAAKALVDILEDPPLDKPYPFGVWRQWREDVEAGKITYRLKGVGGEYNFKGPVASGSSPDRHGSRVPPGRKNVTEGESTDGEESSTGSPPITMIVIAAVILVGAVAWFIVSRRIAAS